jgi:hypothetical protein
MSALRIVPLTKGDLGKRADWKLPLKSGALIGDERGEEGRGGEEI